MRRVLTIIIACTVLALVPVGVAPCYPVGTSRARFARATR